MPDEPFAALVAQPGPDLDRTALAVAAAFRPVDAPAALERLDALGAELTAAAPPGSAPEAHGAALTAVLGRRHGFGGRDEDYGDPELSMLDAVLESGRGLPILLSAIYAEAARRARWPVWGVGLPGHFVVGHFGAREPFMLDPYRGGGALPSGLAPGLTRPWTAQETVTRMLSNLVRACTERHDLGGAIRAAELRVDVPSPAGAQTAHRLELRALRARLN